jgi:hypothetical protein
VPGPPRVSAPQIPQHIAKYTQSLTAASIHFSCAPSPAQALCCVLHFTLFLSSLGALAKKKGYLQCREEKSTHTQKSTHILM